MSVKLLGFLLLFFLLISCNPNQKKSTNISIVAYYVPSDDYPPEKLPLNQLTHIIFSFTKVIDGEMKFRKAETSDVLKKLVEQKYFHPDLKVMIESGY